MTSDFSIEHGDWLPLSLFLLTLVQVRLDGNKETLDAVNVILVLVSHF